MATPIVAGYEESLEKSSGKLLRPEYVGQKIVNQIISCKGGQLVIPKQLGAAAGLRGLPNWIQEFIRDRAVGRDGQLTRNH